MNIIYRRVKHIFFDSTQNNDWQQSLIVFIFLNDSLLKRSLQDFQTNMHLPGKACIYPVQQSKGYTFSKLCVYYEIPLFMVLVTLQ